MKERLCPSVISCVLIQRYGDLIAISIRSLWNTIAE